MRLIDADRLKLVLEKNFGEIGGNNVLQQIIDKQPTIKPSASEWHVVAEGDLPEEVGNYLVTVERTFFDGKYPRGRVVREVLQAYFKRDDSYIVGYVWWSDCAGLDDRDVLAWRELPEPWEGAEK